MSIWEEKRLDDLVKVNPVTISTKDGEREIEYIDISSVSRGVLEGYRTYTIAGAPSRAKREVKQGDTLFSTVRPNLRAYYYVRECPNNAVASTGFAVLRARKIADKRFVYYLVTENSFVDWLTLVAKGSAYPAVDSGDFKKAKITVPDLPTQTRIADILSAYDDAIENNNRRIDLLEKAAHELYKEWFVRFRFPGHESARLVNGLPEGWERAKFKGIIAYNTGKIDSNAMTANGKYSFYTCAKQIYATDTFCFDGECVLLGGNNATGDFSLFYANEKLDAYQRTYIVTPLNPLICCPYIFFMLKEYLLTFQITSAGAATKFLTKAMLDRFTILLPTEYVAKEFKLIVQPMFDLRVRLQKQNSNLARQRDLLLPRLMSGKLEV